MTPTRMALFITTVSGVALSADAVACEQQETAVAYRYTTSNDGRGWAIYCDYPNYYGGGASRTRHLATCSNRPTCDKNKCNGCTPPSPPSPSPPRAARA